MQGDIQVQDLASRLGATSSPGLEWPFVASLFDLRLW